MFLRVGTLRQFGERACNAEAKWRRGYTRRPVLQGRPNNERKINIIKNEKIHTFVSVSMFFALTRLLAADTSNELPSLRKPPVCYQAETEEAD